MIFKAISFFIRSISCKKKFITIMHIGKTITCSLQYVMRNP